MEGSVTELFGNEVLSESLSFSVKGKSFFFRSKMKEGILEKILQEIFEEEEDVVNEEGEYYCYLKF